MARLPVVGGDTNEWGAILNEFLSVALNSDGTLKTVNPAGGGTGIDTSAGTGTPRIDAGTWSVGTPKLESYTLANLPPADTAGRLAQVTDNIRGIWRADGTKWSSITGVANILDFGAIGDGVADDTAAMQAAANAAAAAKVSLFAPSGAYRLSSTVTVGSSIVGDGSWDSGSSTRFLWYGSAGRVLQFGAYEVGWRFENFRIDMRNVTTDTVAMYFTQGLVGATFRNLSLFGYYVGGEYKNHDGIYIVGGNGLGTKYDNSLNVYDHVHLNRLRYGIEGTDPDNQGSGGENTFIQNYASVNGYAYRFRGPANTWIGGDFSTTSGNTIFRFSGGWVQGQVLIGVNAGVAQATDYAITLDSDTSAAGGSVVTVVGGKVYTGSWLTDAGVGTTLRRWTRIGDGDSLSLLAAKGLDLQTQDALTLTISDMAGILGSAGRKFMQFRPGTSGTDALLLLPTAAADGTNNIYRGPVLVAGSAADASRMIFAYTTDGTTLIKIAAIYPGAHGVGARRFFPEDIASAEKNPNTANGQVAIMSGAGSPEGVVTAPVGSLFLRSDGGAGTTLYVKQSGTGNTGWVGK